METIGARIKLLRDELGLSMAAFGDKIKMTNSNVSKMEKDLRVVTDRTIALICSEFKVNEEWLRTGEGEMFITLNEEFADIVSEAFLKGGDEYKELMIKVSKMSEKEFKLISDFANLIIESKEK